MQCVAAVLKHWAIVSSYCSPYGARGSCKDGAHTHSLQHHAALFPSASPHHSLPLGENRDRNSAERKILLIPHCIFVRDLEFKVGVSNKNRRRQKKAEVRWKWEGEEDVLGQGQFTDTSDIDRGTDTCCTTPLQYMQNCSLTLRVNKTHFLYPLPSPSSPPCYKLWSCQHLPYFSDRLLLNAERNWFLIENRELCLFYFFLLRLLNKHIWQKKRTKHVPLKRPTVNSW